MQTKGQHDNSVFRLELDRPKTVKRTIRMDFDISEKLEDLSTKQRLAFNSLLNKALRRYVDWEVFAESFGLITVEKKVWKTLLGRLTELEARELGRRVGAQSTMDFVTYYFRRFDLESVICCLQLLGAEYMRNFQFVDFGEGDGTRTVVLRHSLGPAASAFYGESVRTLFERLHVSAEIEESDDQIVLRIISAEKDKKTT